MVVVFVVGRDHRSGAGAKIASFVARLVVKAVVGKTRGSSLGLPADWVRPHGHYGKDGTVEANGR
jgi:hypothetical protein